MTEPFRTTPGEAEWVRNQSVKIQGAAVQCPMFGERGHELPAVPVALRWDRDPEALAIANGVPVGARRATAWAMLGAVVLLLAFVLAAILRSP